MPDEPQKLNAHDLELMAREHGKPLPEGFQAKVLSRIRERRRLRQLNELSKDKNLSKDNTQEPEL